MRQYSLYQHNNSNSDVADLVAEHAALPDPDSNVTDGYTTRLHVHPRHEHGRRAWQCHRLRGLSQASMRCCSRSATSARARWARAMTSAAAARAPLRRRVFQAVDQDPFELSTFHGGTGPALTLDANGAHAAFRLPRDAYNFGPLNYYQRPDDRYTAGLFAHYDLNEHATAYTEFMFMNDKTCADCAERAFLGCGSGSRHSMVTTSSIATTRSCPLRRSDALCNDLAVNGQPATRTTCSSASAGATSKVADARTISSTPPIAACSACAATSAKRGATTPTACTAPRIYNENLPQRFLRASRGQCAHRGQRPHDGTASLPRQRGRGHHQ